MFLKHNRTFDGQKRNLKIPKTWETENQSSVIRKEIKMEMVNAVELIRLEKFQINTTFHFPN